MASDQVSRRRENTTTEREIHVETDKVPKMTIHFESLADKARASDPAGGKETPHGEARPRDGSLEREGRETARQTETMARQDGEGMREEEKEERSGDSKQLESLAEKVKTIDVGGQKGGHEGGERGGRGTRGESLAEKVEKTEIGGAPTKGVSRGEEGEKGRERAGQEGRERSEGGRPHREEGGRRTKSETLQVEEKGGQMRGESAAATERKGGEEMQGQKKGQEEEAQPTLEEVSRLRALAQQNSMDILRAAEERYNQAKEQAKVFANQGFGKASEKAAQTKDTFLHGAHATTEYVAEKGAAVKDTAMEKGQQGLGAAKETVLSAGKTARDYTVPKTEQAKDYTSKQMFSRTIMQILETEGAEQAKGVVTQAKEMVEGGARKAKESTQEILEGSTKEGKTGTGEQVVQGKTGHRKTEEQQPRGSALAEQPKGVVTQAKEMVEGGARKVKESTQEIFKGLTEEGKIGTGEQVVQGKTERRKTEEQQPGGGVLGAIGETIAEIAQTTKEYVVGRDEPGGEEANLAFSASSTEPSKQGEHNQDRSK
ncbi:seed biotin-containing protein SBP65-like [Syzygium oleosum]|uniref:seed biotin-containing protein SBP65-like n=1 Tax=Syzygium oleosum TaxID=219896 RepID=UPI0011D2A753|nr:seed biotin-containing protein SBP65-like [Syzygium oleosum]